MCRDDAEVICHSHRPTTTTIKSSVDVSTDGNVGGLSTAVFPNKYCGDNISTSDNGLKADEQHSDARWVSDQSIDLSVKDKLSLR